MTIPTLYSLNEKHGIANSDKEWDTYSVEQLQALLNIYINRLADFKASMVSKGSNFYKRRLESIRLQILFFEDRISALSKLLWIKGSAHDQIC